MNDFGIFLVCIVVIIICSTYLIKTRSTSMVPQDVVKEKSQERIIRVDPERRSKFCSNCGAEIDVRAKICPKCGVEQFPQYGTVSDLWYLVPFFFALLGGVVAWAANKDRDPRKARNMLIFGIIWTFVSSLVIFLFWTAFLAFLSGIFYYP